MSNFVFVLNHDKTPLNPVHPAKARKLLSEQQAAIFRRYPFTIVLKQQVSCEIQEHELKIDPGSKFTGLAILQGDKVLWGAEISHRGQLIKDKLLSRSRTRRGRRNRNTRYRKPRFLNRTKKKGWLAPSLEHRSPLPPLLRGELKGGLGKKITKVLSNKTSISRVSKV